MGHVYIIIISNLDSYNNERDLNLSHVNKTD